MRRGRSVTRIHATIQTIERHLEPLLNIEDLRKAGKEEWWKVLVKTYHLWICLHVKEKNGENPRLCVGGNCGWAIDTD